METLRNDLKNNRIRNLYLFYGPEEYLREYYLGNIEKKLLNTEFFSLNRILMQGKVSNASLIDCCETLPVFSEKKLVIVKDSGFFRSKKNSGADELAGYFKNLPDYTCLIFLEDEIDKRTKTVKSVKEHGLMVEFKYQKPADLVKWVIKVFKAKGKEIGIPAASWLVENCQPGMTYILNEIDKVTAYTQQRDKVTIKDLENVCIKSIKTRIFDLTDAIGQKDSTKALKLLDDMVVLREPLPIILHMISRQFRHILEMKALCSEGCSLSQAASNIGLTPYAAKKTMQQTQNFTVDRLKKALERCLEIDTNIKTGKINERIATELLIAEFSK
ncbi:MAG: DNA polymerase III subunit delta [Acetivibrionales bacterium]|jgi:DNA polymerase-3 subunit delta